MSNLKTDVNRILREIKEAKRKGDRNRMNAAFKELYERAYDPFNAHIALFLCNASDREACILNAFEKIYKFIEHNDPERNGLGWMFQTLRRCAHDINEEERRHRHAPLEKVIDFIPDRSFSMDDKIEITDLRKALKKLSSEEKKLVVLLCFRGLTMEKTAKKLKVAKSTVFDRFKKISVKLRKILEE